MKRYQTKRPEMGKWELYKFFSSVPLIRRHLPETSILTEESLKRFLSKYGTVFIKPNYGQCGDGIIKAWRTKKKKEFKFIRTHGTAVHCTTLNELFTKIRSPRKQIVQKGIDLAKVNGRPFDVRLLMMADANRQWQYIGMLAKLAGDGWIITNKRSNGTVLTVDEAFQRSLDWNDEGIQIAKTKMTSLGVAICRKFDKYNRYRNIGIDLGVDNRGKIWVIEENTGPGTTLFALLPDKSMYDKIVQLRDERGNLQTIRA